MSVQYNVENNTGTVISVKDIANELKKHRYLPKGVSTLTVPDEENPVISSQLTALQTQFGASVFKATAANRNLGTLINLGAPDADGVATIHANFAGNNASLNFPGPFTNPDVPRGVAVTFVALWDGGNVTLTGTDQFGNAQTEVIVAVAGTTVPSTKIWKTLPSATKGAVGVNAAAASIGTTDELGVVANITADAVLFADDVSEVGTIDVALSSVLPTTAPDGAVVFKLLASVPAA